MHGYSPVFRSGRLHEFVLVENTLKENGIPYISQQNTISGLNIAPVCPASAPGLYWSVFVAQEFVDKAVEVLSDLPIEIDSEPPELWHFSSDKNVKSSFRLYALVILILTVGILFMDVIIKIISSMF